MDSKLLLSRQHRGWTIELYQQDDLAHVWLNCYRKYGRSQQPTLYQRDNGELYSAWDFPESVPQAVKLYITKLLQRINLGLWHSDYDECPFHKLELQVTQNDYKHSYVLECPKCSFFVHKLHKQ